MTVTGLVLPLESPCVKTGRVFVYLAYLDDSDTKNKAEEWRVIGAVLIPADSFTMLEFMSAITLLGLMPEDRQDEFEEFHACELFGGYGVFQGIDREVRHEAIRSLLGLLTTKGFKVAYGAVNLKQHRRSHFGAAPPHDVAFRRCVLGVGKWIEAQVADDIAKGEFGMQHTALFIMDECDGKIKSTLLNSFRDLRTRFRFADANAASLPFVHDDMYFGESKYSIGIQIADLCSYFIARHLRGDTETESFYQMIQPHIISAVIAET